MLTSIVKLHHESIPAFFKSCAIHVSVGKHGCSAGCHVCQPWYAIVPSSRGSSDSSTTCPGNRSLTLLLLAVLAQVSLFYTVLLAPIAILLILGPTSRLASPYQPNVPRLNIALTLGQFLGFSVLLTAVSGLASGNWSWLSQTWGARYASSCLPSHILTLHQFHAS